MTPTRPFGDNTANNTNLYHLNRLRFIDATSVGRTSHVFALVIALLQLTSCNCLVAVAGFFARTLKLPHVCACEKLVRPLLKHARSCAKTAGRMRRAEDSEVIDRLPHFKISHQAAVNAMMDLYFVHRAFRKTSQLLPVKLRSAVNVMCAAAIFLFTDHGRPGEWEHVKITDVTEMLDAKDDKTVRQFGLLATCCPPLSQKSFELVRELPNSGSGLLMEPPNWKERPPTEEIMTVYSSKLLRKCVSTPQEEEMWVTLKGKQQHCLTEKDQRDQKAAMEVRCSLDGHTVEMGKALHGHILGESRNTSWRRIRETPRPCGRRLLASYGISLAHSTDDASAESDSGSSS